MSPVLALPARDMDPVRAASHVHLAQSTGMEDARRSPFTPLSTPLSTPAGSHRTSSLSTRRSVDGTSASSSANTPGTAHKRQDSQGHVCLCTPAPKIPRPRNAFILYRQHHQAQVTADNPRLSNPDISKIIGGQWKRESDMEKQRWKKMADEEKQRHQNQYPNYRYQPRRSNKPQNGWPGASSSDEQGRCPKCNGKTTTGPQAPSTSASQSSTVKPSPGLPSLPGLESALSRRTSFDLSSPNALPSVPRLLPSVRDMHLSEPSSPPDVKRRRADDSGSYHAVDWRSSSYQNKPPPVLESREVSSPSSFVRTPLPELRNLARTQNGPVMAPPLLPSATSWLDKDALDSRHGPFDESLRLPPLQAPVSTWPSRSMSLDVRQGALSLPSPQMGSDPMRDASIRGASVRDASIREASMRDALIIRDGSLREAQQPQAKTLRDAIMSISPQDKIAVLANICQPIPPLATDADADDTRGAFISIEGADAQLLREVGDALETGLEACRRYMLRVWRDDKDERLTPEDEDMHPLSQPDRHDARRYGDMFEPYLNAISTWQKKSRQIGRYVTGKTQGQKLERQLRRGTGAVGQMPVALARDGFSLTIADRYACAMPIVDMYAPADHWQWMATLWRGTVSPDLIVYVMSLDEGEARDGPSVELSRREGLVTVKLPADRGLDEATARRVVFEVLQWVQQESYLQQVPQGWRAGGTWRELI